jgi:hypothetical protein
VGEGLDVLDERRPAVHAPLPNRLDADERGQGVSPVERAYDGRFLPSDEPVGGGHHFDVDGIEVVAATGINGSFYSSDLWCRHMHTYSGCIEGGGGQ